MIRSLLHLLGHHDRCVCSHSHQAHEHYRQGDDCGFASCGCRHFRDSHRA